MMLAWNRRGGEKLTGCGYILKVETTAFPDELDRGMREREKSKITVFCVEQLKKGAAIDWRAAGRQI